jgi:hypothetical protein
MSLHIGTVVGGGFSSEKEAIAEDLGGGNSNFSFEQDKSWYMPILSYK